MKDWAYAAARGCICSGTIGDTGIHAGDGIERLFRRGGLMEVPRSDCQSTKHVRIVDKLLGQEMNHFSLALNIALDAQQSGGKKLLSLFVTEILPDNDIYPSGFILQCDEYHAGRCARTLSPSDKSCSND